jgi:hypothetical protein
MTDKLIRVTTALAVAAVAAVAAVISLPACVWTGLVVRIRDRARRRCPVVHTYSAVRGSYLAV